MIADILLDMLASAFVAPPLRWMWSRYWPTLRDRLVDMFDAHEES